MSVRLFPIDPEPDTPGTPKLRGRALAMAVIEQARKVQLLTGRLPNSITLGKDSADALGSKWVDYLRRWLRRNFHPRTLRRRHERHAAKTRARRIGRAR